MNTNTKLSYFWKLPLCGLACIIGMAVSGILLSYWVFNTSAISSVTDVNTSALYIFIGIIIFAFTLSFISTNLRFTWWVRWIILVELVWIIGILGITIASFFFTGTGLLLSFAIAITTMLIFLLPIVILSGFVAVLFRPYFKSL